MALRQVYIVYVVLCWPFYVLCTLCLTFPFHPLHQGIISLNFTLASAYSCIFYLGVKITEGF